MVITKNYITVRTAYASEIWAQLTKTSYKNQAQKDSGENINEKRRNDQMTRAELKRNAREKLEENCLDLTGSMQSP